MPVNRNALIRFKTLDNCLKNRFQKWTLEDLMEACSEALYEYEGVEKGVSKRTVQMDIQMMRSDKLGYNAPIVVTEKKYYSYSDPEYSITNIPLTDQDIGKLTEVAEILKQFKGFSHFQEVSGMVQRLENKIYSAKTKQEPVIDFEKNDNLKGLEFIETLYQTIISKRPVQLKYQSFKARDANDFTFHPYYLKEYRNRWFVLGVRFRDAPIMTLALDRIINISPSEAKYITSTDFDPSKYFNDTIGVSVSPGATIEKIVFFADRETAPYIITKPLHHTQQVVERLPNGTIFSINVQLNFELEREILGFGDRIKIMEPERLKRRIRNQIQNALDLYDYELSDSSIQDNLKKFERRGFAIMNQVYKKKEINMAKALIHSYLLKNSDEEPHAIRSLFEKIPTLREVIVNSNLQMVLSQLNRHLFLTKAIFFDKSPEANWYVTWHQDITIGVKKRIESEGFTGWTKKSDAHSVCPPEEILKNTVTVRIHLDDTNGENGALKVIPGSHNKKLDNPKIQLITQNSLPVDCLVDAGGIHVMRPLLLHASSKATSQKHRRVVHLEFNTKELPDGLEWAERSNIDR